MPFWPVGLNGRFPAREEFLVDRYVVCCWFESESRLLIMNLEGACSLGLNLIKKSFDWFMLYIAGLIVENTLPLLLKMFVGFVPISNP